MMHPMMMMYMRALMVLYLLTPELIAAYQTDHLNFTEMKPNSGNKGTIFIRIIGNVYPLGYYAVKIRIGNQPKPFLLDIDTGSDLTWVSCHDAQPPPRNLYDFTIKPAEVVLKQDPACATLGDMRVDIKATGACNYKVGYADGYSSTGLLVKDAFPLRLRDGKWVNPRLAFGCENYQPKQDIMHQPNNDGILGLGKGGAGILRQLSNMDVIENSVGHCFSGKGGGYIFFGEAPILGVVWKQTVSSDEHYSLGSADIIFNGHNTDIRGLRIIFDSGSTYTYLKSIAYKALFDLIKKNLNKDLTREREDKTLPVCWKGTRPFTSIDNVARYFWDLGLSFQGVGNVKFRMHPKSYLIISEKGNVCLGILNGEKAGLGEKNLIGDISMHDKLVIYDNKHNKVGWVDANCNV